MEASEFIGLDVGKARTGLARGSGLAKIAQPLNTLPTIEVMGFLRKQASQAQLAGIVVGLPRSLEGGETAQTAWVRQWVDEAKKQLKLPFYWQDEALTTLSAEKKALDSNGDVDVVAAQLILQDFLDTPEAARVVC